MQVAANMVSLGVYLGNLDILDQDWTLAVMVKMVSSKVASLVDIANPTDVASLGTLVAIHS